VFHATDSYGAHRKKLMDFYDLKYEHLRLASHYTTARADACGCNVPLKEIPHPRCPIA
jgi:hypothetical protein